MSSKDGDQQGNDGNNPEVQGHLRSGPSRVRSFSRFINHTTRRVDVIWLNYEGQGVRYRTLGPGQSVNVNTFEGHLFIFRDSDSGDRLCAELRQVFEPLGSNSEQGPSWRRIVYITNPLYSLRDRCLQEVRRLVPADLIPLLLEVPRELRNDLLGARHDIPVTSVYQQPAVHALAHNEQADVAASSSSDQQNMNNNNELAVDRNCTNNNNASVVDQNSVVVSRSSVLGLQGRSVTSSSRSGHYEPRSSERCLNPAVNPQGRLLFHNLECSRTHSDGAGPSSRDQAWPSTSSARQDCPSSGRMLDCSASTASTSQVMLDCSGVQNNLNGAGHAFQPTSVCSDMSSSEVTAGSSALPGIVHSSLCSTACVSSPMSQIIPPATQTLGSCAQKQYGRVQEVSCPMVSSTVTSGSEQNNADSGSRMTESSSETNFDPSLNEPCERQEMDLGNEPPTDGCSTSGINSSLEVPDDVDMGNVEFDGHDLVKTIHRGSSAVCVGNSSGMAANDPQDCPQNYKTVNSFSENVNTVNSSVEPCAARQGECDSLPVQPASSDVDMPYSVNHALPNGIPPKGNEDDNKSLTHKHCHSNDDPKFVLPLKKRKQ